MKRQREPPVRRTEAFQQLRAMPRDERSAFVCEAIRLIQEDCAEIVARVPTEFWLLVIERVESLSHKRPVFCLACVSWGLWKAARLFIQRYMAALQGTENRVLRHFPQLRTLKLRTMGGSQVSRDLVATLTSLTSLTLDSRTHHLDDDALAGMKQLRVLSIKNPKFITGRALRGKAQLHTLVLRGNTTITNSALTIPHNLTSLDLSFNAKITDLGLKRLWLLQELSLRGNSTITDDGISHLVHLHTLNLHNVSSRISDRALTRLTNLTRLQLTSNHGITDAGLWPLKSLRRLWLCFNEYITSLSLCELPQLSELCLYGNRTVPARSLSCLTRLEYLVLSPSTEMTPRELGSLISLRHLVLYHCDEALDDTALGRLTGLRKLTYYGERLPAMITLERWLGGSIEIVQLKQEDVEISKITKKWLD